MLSANVGVNLQGVLTDGVDGYVSIADIEYDYTDGQFVEDRVKVEFENSALASFRADQLNMIQLIQYADDYELDIFGGIELSIQCP